jgi:hypothetical protein
MASIYIGSGVTEETFNWIVSLPGEIFLAG